MLTVVQTLSTSEAAPELLQAVRGLMDEAFEGDFTDDDWAHGLGGWHAVATERSRVLAHAALVPRLLEVGDRAFEAGYVEGVATAPDRRGEGLGARVVLAVMETLRARFEVGALSTRRHGFYERLGWERWRGPTYVRDGAVLLRTPEEDAGIMVLRFGGSLGIDLGSSITCEAREGDDW